jgi:N-acetylneuraminic acid mutarotase
MKRIDTYLEKPYSNIKIVSSETKLNFYGAMWNNSGFTTKFYLLFILLLCSLTQFAQDSLWTQKADLNYSRWHSSANYYNGKIYVIGGLWNANTVEEYTIETDTWQTKKSMPTPRAFVGSGVVDGKIYIIGGAVQNTNVQRVVEMYDPETDEWTSVESLNKPRFGMASCVYNNKIYTFGGHGGPGPRPGQKTVEAFDPIAGEWISDLEDMPTARWEPECVLVDSQIYVIGGFYHSNASTGASAEVEAYNPKTDSWTVKAPLPEKRAAGAVASLNGKIYYIGGNTPSVPPLKNIWEYDPELDQWYILPDMPFGWTVMSSCVVDDEIFLMTGSKVSYPFGDDFREVYTYKINDSVPRTAYVPDIPANIENTGADLEYAIFPIPATNTLHIENDNSSNELFYRIFNIYGMVQMTGTIDQGSVNIGHLDKGIYFIELDNNEIRVIQKFMKIGN